MEIRKLERTIVQLETSSGCGSSVSSVDNDDEGAAALEEIGVLQWPMLFGEACIIDPDSGISAGRIMADTPCEVFCIHKLQLQTFRIQEKFVEAVKAHAVKYPNDSLLVESLKKKKEWDKFKDDFIIDIKSKSVRKSAQNAVLEGSLENTTKHEEPFR